MATIYDNIGTTTAPSQPATPTQDKSWMNSNSGLIGTVTNANANGYAPTNTSAASYAGTGYNANLGTAATYDNANWNVDKNQTVQGQVANIIDQNSPLMQRAETRANQASNARGLLNSSMAVGAGQAALYDAALPMAQQDASTFANAGQFNANATNQSRQFNASNQQQTGLANQQAKNAAAEYGATAANQSNQFNAANEQQTRLSNQSANNQASQFGAAAGNQAALANAQAANALQQQTNELRYKAAAGDQAAQLDLTKQNLDNQFKASLANADAQTKGYLTNLENWTKTNLASIEADYKTLMQTSASASDVYKGSLSAMTSIMESSMDPEAKASALNSTLQMMKVSMNVIGSVNGIDLTDLLDQFGSYA